MSGQTLKGIAGIMPDNEIAKARDALAAGRAIIGKLVEHYPDQARWKQDLAWFDAQISTDSHPWDEGAPVCVQFAFWPFSGLSLESATFWFNIANGFVLASLIVGVISTFAIVR
jgi:hypothetical protein